MTAMPAVRRFSGKGPFSRRLVCVPSAGGPAASFRPWAALVGADTEVCAVELPGRGARLAEAPITDLARAIDEVLAAVESLTDVPFVLLGHSFGALLSFETARRLASPNLRGVVASHSRSPSALAREGEPSWHQLSDDDLVARLRLLGATPDAILDSADGRDLFLPAIRADLSMYEAYAVSPDPLGCLLLAVGAVDDPVVDRPQLLAWRDVATDVFYAMTIPGAHFSLHTDAAGYLGAVMPFIDRRMFASAA